MEENELGKLVRRIRIQKGLSLRGMARILGVEYSMIFHLEKGTRWTEKKNIDRILQVLGITVLYVVDKKVTFSCKRCLHRQTIEL